MATNLRESYQHFYTIEEYYALEKVGDARYEYWDGSIFCMSGGSEQHGILTSNLHREFSNQLKGSNCRAFTEGTPIATPTLPPYRYPDLSIVCGDRKFQDFPSTAALVNPILIVEVLSATTEIADRNQKRLAYQALPSLQIYLLVSQTAHHVTKYVRQGDFWQREEISGLDSVLQFPALQCELLLRDIYDGVVFP